MPASHGAQHTDAENSRTLPKVSGVGGREAQVKTGKLPRTAIAANQQPGTPGGSEAMSGEYGQGKLSIGKKYV